MRPDNIRLYGITMQSFDPRDLAIGRWNDGQMLDLYAVYGKRSIPFVYK
jgi:hypothetical protein